jgi:cytochrome P450
MSAGRCPFTGATSEAGVYSGKGNSWESKLWKVSHPYVYPILKSIARLGTNVRLPGIGLAVSEASLMREVLNNPVFSKVGKGASSTLWTPITGPTALINMDGADHLNLRRKLGPIFSPRAIAELSAGIMDAPLNSMLERLVNNETVDIVEEVSKVAGAMICSLTGLDASDASVSATVEKARELTAQASLKGTLTDAQVEYSRSILSSLTGPVLEAYNKGDESTVPGKMKALGLSPEEALGASSAFIIAGTETVISYIPRMVALILESGWLEKLAENPDRMNDVIMEGLRLTVPTPVMLRSVTEDATVGGKKIKKGQRVVLLTVTACQRLTRGDVFDPDREIPSEIKNIWFGAGSHFCIGMPLAMAQTKAFINTLLEASKQGKLIISHRDATKHTFAPAYRELLIKKEA